MNIPQFSAPNTAWVDASGRLTREAVVFLRDMWIRIGGAESPDLTAAFTVPTQPQIEQEPVNATPDTGLADQVAELSRLVQEDLSSQIAAVREEAANTMRIRRVIRGTITLSSVTANTATISPALVDLNKTELRNLGFTTNSTNLNEAAVRLALTNTTTITATKNSSSGESVVSYELTEYA